MVEYNIQKLEKLSARIDNLLDKSAMQIYRANKRRNKPKVIREMEGLFGEDQVTIDCRSGDSEIDDLLSHIIDPKNITGTINRGGKKYEANLIWSDILRNGLGPNQYERIAGEARRLALRQLEKEDGTGEKALSYLESKAMDPTQRLRARRDWVGFLNSYAHAERLVRDLDYVECQELLRMESIDVKAVRNKLPSSVTTYRIYCSAEKILDYEVKKAIKSGDFSDYQVRLDLINVFETIGVPEVLKKIRERAHDEREHPTVRKEAKRILSKS
ncbi:MAG: hypothetical protein KAT77_04755 [Nanoarchaeota archaeon]|nr:hypothetical protein [Nanoarchaeota archaeon]